MMVLGKLDASATTRGMGVAVLSTKCMRYTPTICEISTRSGIVAERKPVHGAHVCMWLRIDTYASRYYVCFTVSPQV